MSGFPEQCAKAMAYALMQIALAEQRDCYVIIFSTEHITYELTKQDGLREAADFLTYSSMVVQIWSQRLSNPSI